jgi:hypothetical protein
MPFNSFYAQICERSQIFKYLPDGTMKFVVWLKSSFLRKYPDNDDFEGGSEFSLDINLEGNSNGSCVVGRTISEKFIFLDKFSLDPTSPIKNLNFRFKALLISNKGMFNKCFLFE